MEQKDLQAIEQWFEGYVSELTARKDLDDYVLRNLKSRYDHILRTREEMSWLCERLRLDPDQRRVCDTIVLLHDVGRFEQFLQYRTFSDHNSVNHATLGISILRREAQLTHLSNQLQYEIETAIAGHNLKEMPDDLTGDALLFTRLIRDADKLDIYYCSVNYFRQYREDPGSVELELEFSDEPVCTPEVLAAFLAGRQVAYALLQTLFDLQLLQLCWIYDINFLVSLERLQQRRLLEQLLELLPEGEERMRVEWHVRAYVQSHLQNASTLSPSSS